MDFKTLIKKPSAFIPVVMSLAGIALLAGHIALFGTARQADEGFSAHLWQVLMGGQIPFLACFALRWLPQHPGPALKVMALQALAALASLAPVFILNF